MVKVTVWSLGWFGKLDSKPVKMWDENGSCFPACRWPLASWWNVYPGPVLVFRSWKPGSKAKKLFRSGLIVVGPDWLNVTLHTGLVVQTCRDLVLEDLPAGLWHWWLPLRWISLHCIDLLTSCSSAQLSSLFLFLALIDRPLSLLNNNYNSKIIIQIKNYVIRL